MPRPLEDLTGQTFAAWTVVERASGHEDVRETMWTCRCSCGISADIPKSNLKRGLSTKCVECRAKASRKPPRPPAERRPQATGAAHHRWRAEDIAYSTAHKRVVSRRGNASWYPCVDCGETASDWSREKIECDAVQLDPRGRPYCTHVEHYSPRCRACHNRLDHA